MALAQLLNVPIHTWPASDSFRYIRDFLACRNGIADFTLTGPNPGPGYEIVDEYYSAGQSPLMDGDWVVFKSNGETNGYPHYLKMTFGSNAHQMAVMLHWDAATRSGWSVAGDYVRAINHNNYQGQLSIHADLDECHIITQPSQSGNMWHPFGRFKPDHLLYDGTATRVDEPIMASANRIIHLPIWPGWARTGRKIYSWDTKSVHVLNITGVNEATRVITVSTSYDKEAGSWLAEDMCLFACSSNNDVFSTNAGQLPLSAVPDRLSFGNPATFKGRMYPSYIGSIVDGHYDHRLCGDIWVGDMTQSGNPPRNVRGRFALAKESSGFPSSVNPARGIAWTDEENGQTWRTYICHSSRNIAFLETT